MFWGRGRRNMFWLTGLPGWARGFGFGFGAGRGNPYPFCRWFPWLPRWWWTGIYGPVTWTSQGPVLAQQGVSTLPVTWRSQGVPFTFPVASNVNVDEKTALKEELKALDDERKAIEEEIASIKKRLKELESKSSKK